MFYFDDYDIKDFDDYAIEELTKVVEKLNHIARKYKFGTEEFSFFVGLADKIEKPIRIRKDNKMIEEMNKEMNFEQLREKVEQWADDKDLIKFENRFIQFEKVVEEVFELKEEIIRNNKKNTKLEFGDVIVTLIILSNQLNIDFVDCLQMAYEKISKRHGRTIDGIFVKEEDL